jgi:LPS export ABC transporter protein LptC
MHISRKQSLVIAVGTLFLFFVISILGLQPKASLKAKQKPIPTPVSTVASPAPETNTVGTPSDSKFTLKEFHRSEVRDGKKLWEIFGSEGQLMPEQNAVRILRTKLSLFRPDGTQIDMTANEAVVVLQGAGIAAAELNGAVEVVKDKTYRLKTEKLVYHKAANEVSPPVLVQISGPLLSVQGMGLKGDLIKNNFVLTKNVKSKISPGEKPNAP